MLFIEFAYAIQEFPVPDDLAPGEEYGMFRVIDMGWLAACPVKLYDRYIFATA
jgi:hypothetical protein